MSRFITRVLPAAVLVALLGSASSALAASPTPSASPNTSTSADKDNVTWSAAPADDQFGKNRPHFVYSLAPGTRVTDAIAVVNRSATPITLRLYASDGFTTSNGTLDLLPAAKKPVDVGSWITVSKSTITLKPQQSTTVPFTVTIPAGATPGDHTGGVVTSFVSGTGSGSVSLDRRLGSRVYLRVSGALSPALKVGGVHLDYSGTMNPAGSGTAHFAYTVTNTGNVRLAAHQKVRISGLFGSVTRTAVLSDLPELLPGNSLTQTAVVDGVLPGIHLSASVQLQPLAGPDDPAVSVGPVSATTSAWAMPWGQLIVVVVVAVAVVLILRERRRRAARVSAAIEAALAEDRLQRTP